MANTRGNRSESDADDLHEIRVRRDSPVVGARDAFLDLKNVLTTHIIGHLEPGIDKTQRSQIRPYVHDQLDGLLDERGIVLNRSEKRQLLEAIVADLTNGQL